MVWVGDWEWSGLETVVVWVGDWEWSGLETGSGLGWRLVVVCVGDNSTIQVNSLASPLAVDWPTAGDRLSLLWYHIALDTLQKGVLPLHLDICVCDQPCPVL